MSYVLPLPSSVFGLPSPNPLPFTLYPLPFTLYPLPFTLHPSPFTLYPSPFTLHPLPLTFYLPVASIGLSDAESLSHRCTPNGIYTGHTRGKHEGNTKERRRKYEGNTGQIRDKYGINTE